ncbi:hypothetical protein HDU81_009123 [Chytriomyces hyalinus]|nr:hypothetical protein HDU81_009123 [Chytriomyces hyalinus]
MHAQKRVYTVTNAEQASSIESLHPPPPGIGAKPKPTAAVPVQQPKEPQPASHSHTVKFTLSVTYALERKEKEVLAPLPRSIVKKGGAGGAKGERMSMITPTTTSSKAVRGHLTGANASGVAQTSSDEKRTFYLQYSLGSHVVDAKSSNFSQTESIVYMNPLSPTQPLHPRLPPPAPTEWTATHEVDVTAETISQHLAARPVLIKVFELMRVEVEKKSGLTREMLELMASKSLKGASLADAGLEGMRMRKMRDNLKYGDEGDNMQETEKERHRDSLVRSNNLEAGGVEFVHFLSRQRSASNGPHEYPHPHHYDHPEKHMRRGSTNSIYAATSATSRNDTNPNGKTTTIRRTRSSQSLAAIKSLRPKTPPSPHHHQHPLATLRNTAMSASEAAASIGGRTTPLLPPAPPPDLSAMRFIRRPPTIHSASPTATTTNVSPESRVNTPPWLPPTTNGTHVSEGDVSSTVTGVSGNARRVKSDTSKSATTSLSQELAAAAAATNGVTYTAAGKAPFPSLAADGFGSKSLTHLTKALLDPDTLSQISGNTVGGKTKKASQMGKGKDDEKNEKKKKKFVFEVRKVLVGRLFLDLTSLLCGETVTEAVLENPIPGFTQLSGKLSLNTPLLTHQLITHLKPISISLLCAQNIPNTPTPFHKLDESCLPLRIARFAFFNEAPVRWHESLLPGHHGSFALFGTRHVIFAGLLERQELREWVDRKGGELVVRVYDRIPKQKSDTAMADARVAGEDDEGESLFSCINETQMGPYGEAKFDLSEFLRASEKGHRCSRVRAPILPGRRSDLKGGPAAGLWVESGATFVAEFEAWCQIVEKAEDAGRLRDDGGVFGRLIVFCSASDTEVRECIEQAIEQANSLSLTQAEPSEASEPSEPIESIESIEPSEQNDASEPSTDPQHCQEETASEVPSRQDDYISGFCLDIQSGHVFILEGLCTGAIALLKDKLKLIQAGSRSRQSCFQFDPDCRFQERIWDCVGESDDGSRIVRGKLDKSLENLVSTPRIYLKGAVPERAYRSLLWLSKLQSLHFLVENTTARPPNFPSRKSLCSLVSAFGCVAAGASSTTSVSSVSLIGAQLSTQQQKCPADTQGSLPKLPKVFKMCKTRAPRQPRPASPVRTTPRARAPYTADAETCVFNYSMQAQGSSIAQMDRIKMDMKKGYNYLYSDRFSLDLARVDT